MTDMESLAREHGLTYTRLKYGLHDLQRVCIWRYADDPDRKAGHWVIFIHGGGWRDPRNTCDDFWPTVKLMATSGECKSEIRGFISLDYRLSPHPDFPQGPETPGNELRNSLHPSQVFDVNRALGKVHKDYGLRHWILIGHSAGATLAFQALMGSQAVGLSPRIAVPDPSAIIGISGIYDLVKLNERMDDNYTTFIAGTFGANQENWKTVSPARYRGSFGKDHSHLVYVLLAWSPGDTLVDEPELDLMAAKLQHDTIPTVEVVKDLHGEHDFVWEDGSQIIPLIKKALGKVPSENFNRVIENAFSS